MIGLALVKVGIQYAAGGVPAIGTEEYGSLLNWTMAGTVIIVTLGLKFFTRGMLSVSAVLVGLLVGYVVAFALGQVNLGNVGRAAPFALPNPLLESARIDGAGPLKFFKDILVPLSAPTAAALFLVMFVNGWNQYLWPVMVTSEESTYTLVRGMQFFGNSSLRGLMLAVLAFVPPALLVILFQRQVVKGLFDGSH